MQNIIYLITRVTLFIMEQMSVLSHKLSLIQSPYSNNTATNVILFMAFALLYSFVRTALTQLVPGLNIVYTTSYRTPTELIQCALVAPHSTHH